jgi:CheY-like chemotaxis protein
VNTLESAIRSCRQPRRKSTYPRILIIDDDPVLLESLAEMLTIRLGPVHVETCRKPALPGGMVRRQAYDLILCDVSMPDINGLALLPFLRDSAPDAAIVMMSAVADKGVQDKAFLDWATAFLTKPFDRDGLTATLKQLLTTSRA